MPFAAAWGTLGYKEMSRVPVAIGLSLPTGAAAASGLDPSAELCPGQTEDMKMKS